MAGRAGSVHLKALCHNIRAITRDITAPIRLKSGSHFSMVVVRGSRTRSVQQVLELEGLQLAEKSKRSIRRMGESRL